MKTLELKQMAQIEGGYNCFTGGLYVAGGLIATFGSAYTLNIWGAAAGALAAFGNAVDMASNGCFG